MARPARAETLVRNTDYVAVARLYGVSPPRLLALFIAPMCILSVVVRLTLIMAGIILTAAVLGFLGLGAQPPTPGWGAMISSGRKFMLHPSPAAFAGSIYLVSDAPGLGMEVNEALIAQQILEFWKAPHLRRRNGGYTTW